MITRLKRATIGLIGTILLGVCLLGIPSAMCFGVSAWMEPIINDPKAGWQERTILGHATLGFECGAAIGAIFGTIVGLGVAINRLFGYGEKRYSEQRSLN
jgi:hypothetical protein